MMRDILQYLSQPLLLFPGPSDFFRRPYQFDNNAEKVRKHCAWLRRPRMQCTAASRGTLAGT